MIINTILKLLKRSSMHNDTRLSFHHIEDPYARDIEWTTISKKRNKKPWRKLVKLNFRRIEYQQTWEAYLLEYWFFPIIVFFIYLSWESTIIELGGQFKMGTVIVSLLSFVAALLYHSMKPKIFDKNFGYYWHSYKKPRFSLFNPSDKHIKLNEIHAIQLIPRYNEPPKGGGWSYYNFELNIILLDKRRMNVICHKDLRQIRQDATILSDFLDVPIWDAIISNDD